MTERRGFLGLLGVAPVAAAVGVKPPEPPLYAPYEITPGAKFGHGMIRGASATAVCDPAAAAARAARLRYQDAMKPLHRADEVRRIAMKLEKGWPPGIRQMRSNAPWFRAQLAARRLVEQEERGEDLSRKLWAAIVGEPDEDRDL